MAIEVNITPEDIDSLVKDSILKAGLGKVISETLSKTFSSYNNPIEEQLKKFVGEVASSLIREKYYAQIKEAIAVAIEEKITPEIINLTIDTAMKRIVKAADDRY